MTTAHRPTWHPAVGSANQGGYRYHVPRQQFSARDLPGHLTVKTRQLGQGTQQEIALRDLKSELHVKERLLPSAPPSVMDEEEYDDEDEDLTQYAQLLKQGNQEEGDEEEEEEEDEDEDEDEMLRQELERIRQEREEDKKRKEEDEALLKMGGVGGFLSNPLDNVGVSGVKRRWDDDVVFRNQSRDEVVPKKRFINDTIRNDFHLKFLKRYIK